MATLWTPLKLGDLLLPNRIVMAPLTRMRSQQPGNLPYQLNATYYSQRAAAGLIISEATQISPQGQGYSATPGIHSVEQAVGWKGVTQAVHAHGGRIFLQLWHVGRISHSSFQPSRALPVAPSAIKPLGKVTTAQGESVEYETPRPLKVDELKKLIHDYRTAASLAKQAEFDGVEIHGANGYLLDQFLEDSTNRRDDLYGGSIENRARLLLEVVDSIVQVWGPGRVGVRLSPYGTANDIGDSDPITLFSYVLQQLSSRRIAYVHVVQPQPQPAAGGAAAISPPSPVELFRPMFDGTFISAGGYNPESAKNVVERGQADAVAFGRFFISNPDLPARIHAGTSLNPYDGSSFYGGGAKGYIDYPTMTPRLED